MSMELVIVGGGASGLMAAITSKRILGDAVNVTILERLERSGKKILATGNGKCNLTNVSLDKKYYNEPNFVESAFKKFGYNETINFFDSIGVLTKVDRDGRVYPLPEAATAVVDNLRNELKRLNIEERINFDIRKIQKNTHLFTLINSRGLKVEADAVIIASGGKASPVLGSNGTSMQLLKSFDLKLTENYPGLIGVKVDQNLIKGLGGIRVKGVVSLYEKKDKIWEDSGEIQFKNDGISGIVIMQMTSHIGRIMLKRPRANFTFSIDLWPDKTQEEVNQYLLDRQYRFKDLANENFLVGVVNKSLGINLLRRAKIEIAGDVKDISHREMLRLGNLIKNLSFDVKSTYDFANAQVTIGGLDLKEVNPDTLEVLKVPGLFVSGEALNVDGECGGFNLQWAWTSGYLAGTGAAMYLHNLLFSSEE